MSINITGTIKVWAHKHYTFTTCTTSIAKKDKEGHYAYWSVDVKFPKLDLSELKDGGAYDADVTDGFLSYREYDDKEGNTVRTPVIVVMECKTFAPSLPAEETKPKTPQGSTIPWKKGRVQ